MFACLNGMFGVTEGFDVFMWEKKGRWPLLTIIWNMSIVRDSREEVGADTECTFSNSNCDICNIWQSYKLVSHVEQNRTALLIPRWGNELMTV